VSSGYSFSKREIYQVLAILLFMRTTVARVLGGSDAKQAFEMPAEVALAGEAGLDGDLDGRNALSQEEFGAGNAELGLVDVRREADFSPENVVEVEGAEIGKLGEAGERDVFGIVFVQIVFDTLNDGVFVIGREGRETGIAVVEDVSDSVLQYSVLFELRELVPL
jgi:hypothetical protein